MPVGAVPAFREDASEARAEGEALVFDRGEKIACRLAARDAFGQGRPLAGPVLVEDGTSTIYLPSGWSGTLDEHENLIFTAGEPG